MTNGIKHVCELLTRKVYKIENDSQVTAVYKKKSAAGTGDVVVEYIRGKQLQKENFDHVIIAAEACHTVKMLQGHSSAHRQRIDALSSFHYEKTHVVTHMDTRFLPRDKNVWRTVNVSTLAGSELKSMGTVLFNKMADMPQSPPILQTSSHSHMPLPELTLASSSFDRAVCRLSSLSAIDALDMCQGMDNIYTIGSYAYPGVPLLEGAVCSAMKACHSIGYTCPWFYSDPTNRQTIYGPDSSRKRGVLVETYFQSGGRPSLLKRPAYMLVSLVSSVPLLAEVCIKLWLWFCYCLVFFQMLVNPFSKALGRLFAKSKND